MSTGSSASGGSGNKIFNILMFLLFLYLFLLSIALLGDAFKAFGGDFARNLMRPASNPMVGLMIGLLATALTQSSSTTTSIVVSLVAGGAIGLHQAIPMVMGANMGTTVTNTIVSMGQIHHREEFRRAFAASLVHDLFNILSTIIIFPLWMMTNYLETVSVWMTSLFTGTTSGVKFSSPIHALTDFSSELIVGWCQHNGIIILIVSLLFLFAALRYMVKFMKALIMHRAEEIFEKTIFRTPALGFLFGLLFTATVQSSSVTTSLMVPLAGAGMITLAQVFPYTMGANVGTTVTAMLAAFATGSTAAISVAFSHLMFNLSGISIFWFLKFIPIKIAQWVANFTMKSRFYAILYLLLMFFVIPITLIAVME